ncbi:MAG: peptidase Ste24p [Caulobacteraceae bacterium]|nr:peptidase Ste24p [Caulobacteraceae bacterium]
MTARPLARLVSLGVVASLFALPTVSAQAQSAGDLQGLLRDTEIEAILHQDADPLFVAAGLDPKTITVALIGDKELNAFTSTGRFMGINTGLIQATKTPNQLKGVIAHETGHIAGGHAVREDEMARSALRPMLLTLGIAAAALLSGSPDSTDAAAAIASAAPGNGQIAALGYSREQESRADQAGVGFLEKAGESGKGLVDFFDNFRYQEVFAKAKQYAFFQDHPLSSERIDLLRSRVESLPHYKTVDTPEEIATHAIMQAKIDGFMNPRQALSKYKESDPSVAARYARSIALFQTKQPDEALKVLDTLLADQPKNPYFWELKGQILFEYNRAAEAEPAQRKSVELKPEAPLLMINLAQTLITLPDSAKHDEAIAVLRKALTVEDDNETAWHLLARAYGEQDQKGLNLWATAEEYYAGGDLAGARNYATRARGELAANSPEWRRVADILSQAAPRGGRGGQN